MDFWRVEQLVPDRELLLRAEMISPGLSWLQFELVPRGEKLTRLILRAHFIPKPFWGDLYWLSMLRFHDYIFKGMLARFQKQAAASTSEAKRSPPALAAEEEKVA